MNRHFQEELDRLRLKLLEMSFLADDAVKKSCESLFTRNPQLAREVIRQDRAIDAMEIEIDEKGHSLFALGQPVAKELRLVTMILKINTDLERVGDHAVNIAEKGLCVTGDPPTRVSIPMRKMANAVQQMLRQALDSFLNQDPGLAREVLKSDDSVDGYNDHLFRDICLLLKKDPFAVPSGVNLIMVSHNLERIADLAGNISEDVIYLTQAKEVRHRIYLKNENLR
jgi:phosphate transport system protein